MPHGDQPAPARSSRRRDASARRPVTARGQLLVAAATVTVVLAGCGGRVIQTDGATVLVSRYMGDGMTALTPGTLELVDGCLGISGTVVVWPNGTRVTDEDPLTVRIPGIGEHGLGDELEVPGGEIPLQEPSLDAESGLYEVGGVTVPTDCAGGTSVYLANAG